MFKLDLEKTEEPEIKLPTSLGSLEKQESSIKAFAAAAAAKSLQSCPTLCDPTDGSPPGFPIPGLLQARTLEWVAISFSNAWKWRVKVKLLSHVRLFVTTWTAAYQAPPSMGFSRQEYWSGVPLPSPLKHIPLLYWLCQSLSLGGSQQTGKFWKRWEYQTTWPASWEICMQIRKKQLELDMEQKTGSKVGKEYIKAVYCHPAYLTYMQSTSCEVPG